MQNKNFKQLGNFNDKKQNPLVRWHLSGDCGDCDFGFRQDLET